MALFLCSSTSTQYVHQLNVFIRKLEHQKWENILWHSNSPRVQHYQTYQIRRRPFARQWRNGWKTTEKTRGCIWNKVISEIRQWLSVINIFHIFSLCENTEYFLFIFIGTFPSLRTMNCRKKIPNQLKNQYLDYHRPCHPQMMQMCQIEKYLRILILCRHPLPTTTL